MAPTDTAFLAANLDPESVADMPSTILENLLLYHTLRGDVRRESIRNDSTVFTTLGVQIQTSGAILIDSENNTVNMVEYDVACSNGYLHYVDGVLMPPDLMSSLEAYNTPGGSYEGVFDTLMAGMVATNMTSDLKGFNGPYTVSFLRPPPPSPPPFPPVVLGLVGPTVLLSNVSYFCGM